MKFKHTIIALVILAALGGVFYYLNRLPEKPGKDDIPKENLFSFTPEQVEEFTLAEASKPAATFRRLAAAPLKAADAKTADAKTPKPADVKPTEDKPQWEITAPAGVSADSAQIQSFLEEIAGMQGSTLGTAEAPKWSEYGLENPGRSYQFKLKDGKTVELAIGDQNPAGYARYARRNNAAPVLLLDDVDDKSLIEKTLFDMRDKRILPFPFDDAKRIVMHFNVSAAKASPEELAKARQLGLPVRQPQIVITKQSNGDWDLDEPRLRTDHGVTSYLFSTVSGGQMQSVEEESGTSLGKYGLDRPQLTIDMTTPGGTQSLMVGSSFKRGDLELFYARNTVWPHIFTIPRTVFDQLNQDLDAYRERYLFSFEETSAKSLDIQGPMGQVRLGHRGEDWYLSGPPERKLDGVKVDAFLSAIHALRISSYPSDAPNRFAAYGLDKPWMKIHVVYGEKNLEETVVYARKDNKFYAGRQGEPSVYELSSAEPDNLVNKIKELTAEPAPENPAAAPGAVPAPNSKPAGAP